jgi:DNA-directed RNA polymerase specialized sigma24 family protein
VTSTPPAATPLTLAEAAVLLSSGTGVAGRRLRATVESQLARRGVSFADRDDVRAEVSLSLLVSPRREALGLDAVCALVAVLARNKAVDHHRRRRREAPADLPDRAAESPDGTLQRDLDAVSGEVHRRDVSRALVELVRELPSRERRALTATATGTGFAGSGLGRSSHYRALDRARLRLSAAVRSRVAAGLALPALLARSFDHLRAFLLPVGVTAAAAIASAAFVRPAITPPAPAYVHATVTPRLARSTETVAKVAVASVPAPAPVRVVKRRVVLRRPAATRPVAQPLVHEPVARQAVKAAPRPPAAGLDPCRAAQLCQ